MPDHGAAYTPALRAGPEGVGALFGWCGMGALPPSARWAAPPEVFWER